MLQNSGSRSQRNQNLELALPQIEWLSRLLQQGGASIGKPIATTRRGRMGRFLAGGNHGEHYGEATMVEAFMRSLSMILVSEIGDETFIIAAILAMRNKKRVVFSGALAALAIMTVISAALGYVVPNLISKQTTHNAATVLYTFFGLRLLYIGSRSKSNEIHEEIAEVNDKLDKATDPPWMAKVRAPPRSSPAPGASPPPPLPEKKDR